jgi:dTDP-glucose 4,6-dehydratase
MAGKNVLVTGAAGFIGSHLAESCVEAGYNVRAFVRYNSRNDWGWLETSPYREDIEVIARDIRDFAAVSSASDNVDAVFHLAALIGIPYSYTSPLEYLKTNVEGTYNILQAAREHDVPNVLITSTSETYGTAQYVPIDERHPLVAQSPYSASKIAADQLAISYSRSFGLGVKIVRPFNTYGPRQSARAIIPTVIAQIMSGRDTIRLGNTHVTRDLTFVKDTVSAFLHIADSDDLFGETVNVGMNDEISVAQLAARIAALAGRTVTIETDDARVRPEESEVERLHCDNSKLLNKTGWKPAYDLEAGLSETLEWMKGHSGAYKPDLYNI